MVSKLPWRIQEVDAADLPGNAPLGIAVDIVDADDHVVAYEVLREDAELILAKVNVN